MRFTPHLLEGFALRARAVERPRERYVVVSPKYRRETRCAHYEQQQQQQHQKGEREREKKISSSM